MALPHAFFGGAIVGALPVTYEDISNFRQVPDNQEVLLDQASGTATIIIELLEMTDVADNVEALLEHFDNLATDNESQRTIILSPARPMNGDLVPLLEQGHARLAVIGQQLVKKHRSENAEAIDILIVMVLLRLRNVATDMLITLSVPVSAVPQDGLDCDLLLPAGANEELDGQLPGLVAMRGLLATLQIRDWSLFL